MAGRWWRSQVRSSVRAAAAALKVGLGVGLGSLAAATAWAQQAQPAGNAQRGATLASTCLGCHGIEGYRNAYPDYAVPRLAGQHPEYLADALKEYRSDARQYPTMHLQALSLSDQDIADVAAYLASKPLVAASSASPPAPPQPAIVCTSCHGQNGIGVTPMYPSLAGQHASYIARALQEYQTGYRKNPIMNGMAASLKPADITAIADYFSSLKPALHTESRPYFRWTEHKSK
ncbi:MAG TPA: cytochrome c [Steroidobacteraceae bacterium]|nr:cytochrome c [Steroidobacteraceae bacterium]